MNNAEFRLLFEKYHQLSINTAYSVLQNWTTAEDVSQEVLYKLYQIGESLDITNEKKLYSLVRRASINRAMDFTKRSYMKHEFCSADKLIPIERARKSDDVEATMLHMEKREYINMVLEKYRAENPVNFDMLVQAKYLDIPIEDIAEQYGMSVMTAKNKIYGARRRLLKDLKKVYDDYD